MNLQRWIFVLGLLASLQALPTSALAGNCISGTSVAELQTTGPFTGLYQYTLSVTWQTTGASLSHLTFDLGLDACCLPTTAVFDTPAGTSTGVKGPCEYSGELVCTGDPTLPEQQGSAIKWEPLDECDPGNSGTGDFIFYTLHMPGAPSPAQLWIKYGQDACSGPLTGDLPVCGATPVEGSTWGMIKALYE